MQLPGKSSSLSLAMLLLLLLFVGCGDAYLDLFISQSQVKRLLAMFTASILIVLATVYLGYSQDVPIITTPLGKVQGHYLVSYGGNKYKAFQGIPFALPPVDIRRFKDPEPYGSWSGVLVANKFKEVCVGHGRTLLSTGGYVYGVEDCLYLNIHVPTNSIKQLLPVIFYIYGGAFQYSTLSGTEQHYLMDHDIIFVSINYRLGSLGFLSTEDDVVSGNMGLKDQALALQWISKNIEYFGGDPQRITIIGLSAGGSSVHYHYLSPMTFGLFQSGISFSGTAFDCWSQTEKSRAKALKLGELLGCPTKNIRKTVNCLRGLPAYDVVAAQAYFMPWELNEFTPFGPVIEKSSMKSYIDRSPIDIIRSGDAHPIPWITGVTSEEGLYPVAEFALNETIIGDLNKNWESAAPHLLEYYYTLPIQQHDNVSRSIREYYFGDKEISKENFLTLTHLVSDRIFIYDAVKAAKEQASADKAPVWFYRYTYRATDSLSNNLSGSTKNFGVSHADDVLLVLANPYVNATKSAKDLAMQADLIKFWLSVAYKRVPSFGPKWKNLSSKKPHLEYFHIAGPGDFKFETNDDLGNLKFWETINFNENKITV